MAQLIGHFGYNEGANYQTGVHLRANLNTQEYSNTDLRIDLHADGFSVNANNTMINGTNGENFIYIAIRRPHKPPEVATEVFDVNTESNDNNYSTTGFPVDAAISINRDGSSAYVFVWRKVNWRECAQDWSF